MALVPRSIAESEQELDHALREILEEARAVGRSATWAALRAGEEVRPLPQGPDVSERLFTALRATAGLRSTPERSLAKHMGALERANEVRTQRARLKRDLKRGRVEIHGLLIDPPDYVLTAKVFDLLLAVPGYGRVKVNRLLTHCRVSPSKTIGGLSIRQRHELVGYLRR